MQNNVVIIHGLLTKKEHHDKLIEGLSKENKVHYFSYDYDSSLDKVKTDLSNFLKINRVEEPNFFTHSFDSVIFRFWYKDAPFTLTRRVVQTAPFNSGATILETCYEKIPFFENFAGKVCSEFLERQEEIYSYPMPHELGIIAGTKRFHPSRIESLIVPLICKNLNSDGKVFVEETKAPYIKDFVTVNEYHSTLLTSSEVIEKTRRFLSTGRF